MHHPEQRTDTAVAALVQRLADAEDALDGFPVKAMVDQYLLATELDPGTGARAAALASRTMAAWVALINKDIDAFCSTSTTALAQSRQRLICAHEALTSLQQHLAKLEGINTLARRQVAPLHLPSDLRPIRRSRMVSGGMSHSKLPVH